MTCRSKNLSKSFYFFLVLVLLVHEVKSRTYQQPDDTRKQVVRDDDSNLQKDDTTSIVVQNDGKPKTVNDVKCYDDITGLSNDMCSTNDEDVTTDVGNSRKEKRSISALIGGATILAMGVSLSVEVVAYVTECCAFDSRTCDADKKVDNGKRELRDLSNSVDILWAQVENFFSMISNLHFRMQTLWIRIQVVDDTITKMIEILDPQIFTKLNTTQEDLRDRIAKNKLVFQNFESLKLEYNSVFQNVGKAIWAFHGIVTTPLYYLAQRWVVNKVAAAGPGAFDHYKSYNPKKYILKSAAWAKNKWNALKASHPKASKAFAKAAVSIVGGMSLALEVWKIYKTVDRCHDFGDEVVKRLGLLNQLKDNTTVLYNDVDQQYSDIRTTYGNLKSQLQTNELTVFLSNVKEIVNSTSAEFQTHRSSINAIDEFLNGISEDDASKTSALVNGLSNALHSVTEILLCYQNQLALVKNIVETCKTGRQATLEVLYDEAQHYVTCTTPGYIKKTTTVEMARKMLDTATEYSSNCQYNDKGLRNLVCSLHRASIEHSLITSLTNVPVADLPKFIESC